MRRGLIRYETYTLHKAQAALGNLSSLKTVTVIKRYKEQHLIIMNGESILVSRHSAGVLTVRTSRRQGKLLLLIRDNDGRLNFLHRVNAHNVHRDILRGRHARRHGHRSGHRNTSGSHRGGTIQRHVFSLKNRSRKLLLQYNNHNIITFNAVANEELNRTVARTTRNLSNTNVLTRFLTGHLRIRIGNTQATIRIPTPRTLRRQLTNGSRTKLTRRMLRRIRLTRNRLGQLTNGNRLTVTKQRRSITRTRRVTHLLSRTTTARRYTTTTHGLRRQGQLDRMVINATVRHRRLIRLNILNNGRRSKRHHHRTVNARAARGHRTVNIKRRSVRRRDVKRPSHRNDFGLTVAQGTLNLSSLLTRHMSYRVPSIIVILSMVSRIRPLYNQCSHVLALGTPMGSDIDRGTPSGGPQYTSQASS